MVSPPLGIWSSALQVKNLVVSKQRQCEEYKATYAQQLVKGNAAQTDHYTRSLPAVLDSLQALSVQRGEVAKAVLSQCVQTEREVAPIIHRCQEEMARQVAAIQPGQDAELTIHKFKTGAVPPGDFPFEEVPVVGTTSVGTVGRERARQALKPGGSPNLFPR